MPNCTISASKRKGNENGIESFWDNKINIETRKNKRPSKIWNNAINTIFPSSEKYIDKDRKHILNGYAQTVDKVHFSCRGRVRETKRFPTGIRRRNLFPSRESPDFKDLQSKSCTKKSGFILLFQLVESLLSTKGVDFVNALSIS